MSTRVDIETTQMNKEKQGKAVRRYTADLSAVGEPALWGFGGALALGIILICGFLLMIVWNGMSTFWPKPIAIVTLTSGDKVAGEPSRQGYYKPRDELLEGLSAQKREELEASDGLASRTLYRIGNYDLYNEDFRWVSDYEVESVEYAPDFHYFERQEWGPFVGRIKSVILDGQEHDPASLGLDGIEQAQQRARERFSEIRRIERVEIGKVNHELNQARLELRRIELSEGRDSTAYRDELERVERLDAELQREYQRLQERADAIKNVDAGDRIVLEEVGGMAAELPLSQIVRFYPANDLSIVGKLGVYLSRWGEFLTSEPREANTEGGILPAIFGTVTMTLLMVVVVAPFGVITALYLREYAKQGKLVGMVRIAVNNLAGVPSIVYGVFGLGFFAYTVGGSIDAIFYPERLPNPTFGTGGILWASLTLALLTVPVVIVASEEALSAVPRSIREGALACGASKWQTIRSIVLPHAMPGVMTGLILAMARGAGEVAPLMLVGVVKLAPELPIDGFAPFIHLERSFMHLGFHIFDVGFQSRNSEAGKPMVFVTTLLLLGLIVLMNSSAIYIRNRLKKKFAGSQF
ncbi:phosphate ABC transporter permease PstA [Pseudazoarcus pumilus]|uniref:Phosphate transport system permease protein PstA n=1 Tax=Pseudazoarcus pumilus TaxID=2067960 RepID=A0A2I6S687_9RHOO|nr:phosphate ABC transporter permease PstA [Pseudazoarcus pumilus]AUN94772.1 phosphate ABC transporter, permease protein PstA [Pseudazoarcus pumilus]